MYKYYFAIHVLMLRYLFLFNMKIDAVRANYFSYFDW